MPALADENTGLIGAFHGDAPFAHWIRFRKLRRVLGLAAQTVNVFRSLAVGSWLSDPGPHSLAATTHPSEPAFLNRAIQLLGLLAPMDPEALWRKARIRSRQE